MSEQENNDRIIFIKAVIKIKIFVPGYFNKFRCIADKCPDTCCIGWEVDIDETTAKKYVAIDGELGNKIRKHLTHDETGCNIFKLCEGDRCPFLNNCNLCEIQAEKGESFLSKTCTLFPRFFDDFGSFREMGLGFGCPEAARIILSDEEPFTLNLHDECANEDADFDEDFLKTLIDLRKDIFTVLEKKNLSFKKKIENILCLAKNFQKRLDGDIFSDKIQHRDFGTCLTILENMEYISAERQNFVQILKTKNPSENALNTYQCDFEKLMKYYIFRYLLKAVYDYDVLTKVKYGIFASIVISRIYSCFEHLDFEARVKIMYSFSKEVEYSDMNMDLLDEMLCSSFGTEDLISLI